MALCRPAKTAQPIYNRIDTEDISLVLKRIKLITDALESGTGTGTGTGAGKEEKPRAVPGNAPSIDPKQLEMIVSSLNALTIQV
jgi:hypothetical protein